MPDLITEDRKRRADVLVRHLDSLDKARLIDTTAIGAARTAPHAPVLRTTGEKVSATSMAEFLDKYRNVGAGGTVDLGTTVLDFGGNQFAANRPVIVMGGELRFARPKGNANVPEKNCFGIILAASGVTFRGTKLRSNNGIAWTESGSGNLMVDGCDLQWGWDGSYYSRLAFWSGVGAAGWQVVRNLFHDSQNSDRNLEVWGWSGAYSDNRFRDVNDGGHIMDCGAFTFARNYATGLRRMMLEIQHPCADATITLEDNTAYNWRLPWNDSFFLSVMPREAAACFIRRNYANNRFDGPWGPMDNGLSNRFGIAIEAEWGGPPGRRTPGGMIEDNIIGGPNKWFDLIAAGEKDIPARNNRMLGPTDQPFMHGEPGFFGTGSVKDLGGNVQRPASEMPAPPADPGNGNNPPPPPPPTMKLTVNPKVGTGGAGAFEFAWSDVPVGTKVVRIYGEATGDPQNQNNAKTRHAGPPASFTSSGNGSNVSDLWHPGWEFNLTAIAEDGSGKELSRSNVVRATTNAPGTLPSSTEPWPPADNPPPPPDDPIVKIQTDMTITHKSGKVEKFSAIAPVP
jgi:hypothetical protein